MNKEDQRVMRENRRASQKAPLLTPEGERDLSDVIERKRKK